MPYLLFGVEKKNGMNLNLQIQALLFKPNFPDFNKFLAIFIILFFISFFKNERNYSQNLEEVDLEYFFDNSDKFVKFQ